MLADGADIVTQVAEVADAIDRVRFAVIPTGLTQCLTQSPASDRVDTASLERHFLSPA